MRLRHNFAIALSGMLWMGIGILLLTKGIRYLVETGNSVLAGTHQGFSLIQKVGEWTGKPEQGALIIIATGLLLGFFKGRVVLKKSVNRIVNRIRSHEGAIPLAKLYPKPYLFLLLGMMGLGFLFKVLPLPPDVKGLIDFTIGAALINGAMLYFRSLFTPTPCNQ